MKTKLLNVVTLDVVEVDILYFGTYIRLKRLNNYSTFTKLINHFRLQTVCDETSKELQDLGIPYRLERIHKRWQLTEYTIEDAALISDHTCKNKLIYYIKSVDDKSHLLVNADDVEPIEEYHSQWSID